MRWIFVAGLLLLASLLLNLGTLVYCMYALLAVILVSRFLARNWSRNLTARRECTNLRVDLGASIVVNVELENTGSLPIPWVLYEDLLPRKAVMYSRPSLAISGRRLGMAMVGASRRKQLRYKLTCNRRGYYQIGPMILETGDLFGLHRRFRVAAEPQYLMVLPKLITLEGYDINSRRPIGEVRMSYRLFEDPTRIAGVRRYQPGDPFNRVNWRATARTGTLHSKVYEPSTVAGATLLLDFHHSAYVPQHEPVRSDLAVTAAASIANAVHQMGQQIGLVTNGRDAADRIRLEGWSIDLHNRQAVRQAAAMIPDSERLRPVTVDTRRGHEQLPQILEALARLELTDGLQLGELLDEASSRMPRDASVIVILGRVTSERAVLLGALRERGYAVTAIVNTYDTVDFADDSAPLIAEGIPTHHLRDEASIAGICRGFLG